MNIYENECIGKLGRDTQDTKADGKEDRTMEL
jgi:hypothetical protein